ncbi:MAG: helix-turn-helix transcriptional regulator [Blautia sp.]|nr:helix-turn-helix transcriptional regulator [Blautia sp.]
MVINELLAQRHMTKYKLAQCSNIPYTTLNDLCNGKTSLSKCSAETVYKIAKVLNISMEELLNRQEECV